jgi:hypothetical protein
VVNELSDRVNELSERAAASLKSANDQAGTKAATLRDKASTTDFDKLRDTATSSAVAFAQVASERAIAVYTALVARGERVVGTGVIEAAEVVNADMVTTEEPKAIATAEAVTDTPAAPRKRATKAAPAKSTAAKNNSAK